MNRVVQQKEVVFGVLQRHRRSSTTLTFQKRLHGLIWWHKRLDAAFQIPDETVQSRHVDQGINLPTQKLQARLVGRGAGEK